MTMYGHDFDEAAAYARTTRTLRRLCQDYGFEYVLGIFSNGMPEHREEEERQRALERKQRRQARARQRQSRAYGSRAEVNNG
jgi:sugar phosphate isomerase/epimerase